MPRYDTDIAAERYYSKRRNGISPQRRDGSTTSVDNDIQAAAAEQFAAESFGQKFNSSVYENHGDLGKDFVLPDKRTVDVVWLGVNAKTGRPRGNEANLIINPDEQQRWSDVYIVVAGSKEDGFNILGWMDHSTLTQYPLKDWGYGKKFSAPVRDLLPIRLLKQDA
jgi:hypothetical protein